MKRLFVRSNICFTPKHFEPHRFYTQRVRKLNLETQNQVPTQQYELPKPVLVRDFIHDSLYNPEYGYFNDHQERLIFSATNGAQLLNFTQLEDEKDYADQLRELYHRGRHSWGTPTEIFQPWYAIALCDYILANRVDPNSPLVIYEIGGGNGTMAMNILDYIREKHSSIYDHVQYNIIEISSSLHQIQKTRLVKHGSHFQSHHQSIAEWNTTVSGECFIIAMEVMDNMPHDKVVINLEKEEYGVIEEAHVIPMQGQFTKYGDQLYQEVLMACKDPYILRHLSYTGIIDGMQQKMTALQNGFNYYQGMTDLRKQPNILFRAFNRITSNMKNATPSSLGTGESIIYIPTVRLMMLDVIKKYFSHHRLILADFDFLPTEEPGVVNAPCVQKKFRTVIPSLHPKQLINMLGKKMTGQAMSDIDQGQVDYKSQSYHTYLVPKGSCDIFFATNFGELQTIYDRVNGGSRGSVILKSKTFMEKWAQLSKTQTLSGYNPLLQDYGNFSFFLS
jgi:phospholipid N-methyltransferase